MKNLYLIVFLLVSNISFGQLTGSGCPSIDIGGGVSSDTTIECGVDCLTLTAEVLETGQTDTYTVTSIPYTPPFGFDGANNIFDNDDDTWTPALNLPFDFCFFGVEYNKVVVGANGVLTFDLGYVGTDCAWCLEGDPQIPTPTDPSRAGGTCLSNGIFNLSINGAFHDMDPFEGGKISWELLGAPPCRTFVLNYKNVPQFSCTSKISASQIVLYENTNVIDIYIKSRPICSGWNEGNAVIGIQNADGTVGYAPPGRNTGAWEATNEAWRFTPDAAGAPNYVISWYDMNGGLLLADNKDYVACLPADKPDSSYQAEVVYTICDGSTITVKDTITLVREIPDDLTLTDDTVHICHGSSATVSLTEANSYTWVANEFITDPEDSTQTFSPVSSDSVSVEEYTYPFTAYYPGLCFLDSQFVVVVHPPAQLFGDTVEVCFGDSATIGASGINVETYAWTDHPSIISSRNTDSIRVYSEVDRLYEVLGTSDFGCQDVHYVYLHIIQYPKPFAGNITEACGFMDTLVGVPEHEISTTYWAYDEQLTGVSINDSLNDSTAVNVSSSGIYDFYYFENYKSCIGSDTVTYIFYDIPTPFAGVRDSACGNFYFMNAIPSIGSGLWTNPDGLATIGTPSDPQSIINVTPFNGEVEMIWTEKNGTCEVSDTVIIQIFDLPPANAGLDQEVCSLTTFMDGSTTTGTGTWSAVDTSGANVPVTYADINDPKTQVTVSNYNEVIFSWTVDLGVCKSEDRVTVIFRETPVANAGIDDTTCVLCYQLNASPSVGIGTWTSNNTTATFTSVNDSKSNVCVDDFGVSFFYWQEDNGICFDIDTISINFFDAPAVDAGNDTNVCGYTVNLRGSTPGPTGTGTWTAKDASGVSVSANYTVDANDRNAQADVTALGYGCYTFYWTIDYKFCSVVDSVDICFYEQPLSYAGLDQTLCTASGKTSATPSSGTGVWTSNCAYIAFSSPTNPITDVFNNNQFGCCDLIWTETNGVCIDSDTVEFCFYQQPIANAGSNFDTCGFDANLIATPSVGNGLWSSNSPGITFTPNNTPISSVNASVQGYGTYDLYWTETNMNCSDVDTITVGFYQQPISDAGVNDTICGLSYALNAIPSAGSGKWTGNGIFSNDTLATSTVTVSSYGMYTFTWAETNGPCTDNATVSIWFFQQPIANAGTTANFCALNGNLSATASVGNGMWTGPFGASFGTPTNANTSVDVTSIGYGTYTFYWTETNDICADTDSVIINFYEQPVANAGTNDTICGLNTNMNGGANVGLGTWTSTDPQVVFSDVNDSLSGVTVPNYGCYTFTWTLVNGTCTDQDQVTLCFYQVPTPNAGPDDRFCGDFYTFKAQPAIGFGSWSGPSGAIYSDVTDENSTIDISSVGLGSYEFYWKDSNVICVTIDTVELMFLPAPEVNCNCNNDTIYSDDPTYYFSDYSIRASKWDWDFGDGSGSFQRNPSHTYKELGTFDVSLRIWDQFGCDSIHYCKITVENNLRVFIANAFTPNGDGINDSFGPKVRGHFPDTYNFTIYDRWGKLVFESSIPGREWDGTIIDSKNISQQGVYSYRLIYKDYTGQEFQRKGSITLIR